LLLITLLSSPCLFAYPNFVRLIPNGDKVTFDGEKWPGVGHSRVYGGGDLNSFGRDFMRAGNTWTVELCNMDSDADGRTNGEELGDPKCTWKIGDEHPKVMFVTHPGVADECPSPAPSPSIMRIGILGSGKVGQALMTTFESAGFNVLYGVRNIATHTGGGKAVSLQEAADLATIVFLAIPAAGVEELVSSLGDSLKGKIVVDCTNPLTWDNGPVWNPPAEGSMTAKLVSMLPSSKVVKAFNTMGAEHMADPFFSGSSAVQVFLAGNDEVAKKVVTQIAERSKFVVVDAGPLRNAAVLENVAMLFIQLATVGGRGREFKIGISEEK